jgi:RNA polymerase sigma-70 factor (ECF subfamily)
MTMALHSTLTATRFRVDETNVNARPWTAEQVFLRLGPAVHGYLRTQLPSDADDLLSEVFLHVTRGLGRFRGDDAALRRWVFTIAHHKVVDERRRLARRAQAAAALPERGIAPPHEAADRDLVDALHALTPDQREVVVLRFMGDLSLEAVARITRRRVGAVKALQHRALENLAASLAPAP